MPRRATSRPRCAGSPTWPSLNSPTSARTECFPRLFGEGPAAGPEPCSTPAFVTIFTSYFRSEFSTVFPANLMASETLLRPGELKEVLLKEIASADLTSAQDAEVGTVLSVADGVASIYGLKSAMSYEMLEIT